MTPAKLFLIYGLTKAIFIVAVAWIIDLTKKTEYEINLIDNDHVEIHSNKSGKTYIVKPDQILPVLDNDSCYKTFYIEP